MTPNKLDNKDALRFIFAGNSIFTALNTKSQNRFTYKLKKAEDSNLFFVYVLTGSDNYSYVGFCTNGVYKHGKKSKISETTQSISVFKYILEKLKSGTLVDFVEIWHQGLCGKCGRRLTVPQSIIIGIGPDCINKLKKIDKRDKFLDLILC
jgi:hypothetical protein